MFKSIEITVYSKTLSTTPKQAVIELCKGTLRQIVLRPAFGPNWEVYARVKYREYLLWPNDESEWVPLERYPVEILPNWSNWDGTYDITIELCSPQARFNHNVVVDIDVDEQPSFLTLFKDFIAKGF